MSDMQKPFVNKAAEPETKNVLRFSRVNALWLFLIAAAGLVASGFLSRALADFLPKQPQLNELCTNLIYYLPFLVLPVYLSIRRKPEAAASMRPDPINVWSMIYIGVLAVLCVFMVSDMSLIWCIPLQKLGFDVFKNQVSIAAGPETLVLSVFTAAAIPGVCEELVFRGVVLSGFEDEGSSRAVRMSALLFALLHGSITGFPGQYVLGVVMAMMVISSNSIYAGMVFHTVYNAAVMILEFLQRDLPAEVAYPSDIVTAVGGWAGVLLLAVEVVLIVWMLKFSLNVFHMRGHLKGVRIVPDKKRKFQWDEKVLLIAALIIVIVLFVSDGLYMLQ